MALKKTPANAGRRVKPALPHGKPNPPIPHFKGVPTLGKPNEGGAKPFKR